MYRGRLIFPFLCEIASLDLVATAADPDGAGPLTSGYDPIFRETVILPSVDRIGTSGRVEAATYKIPGQFSEGTNAFLQLMMAPTGNLSTIEFSLVFFFPDLERAGLVEASTGLAKIKVGDRLVAIYDKFGNLSHKVPKVPGAYVSKAEPHFGLNGGKNLLMVTFRGRDPGATS